MSPDRKAAQLAAASRDDIEHRGWPESARADYSHVPKGWQRVQAAVVDRVPWEEVSAVMADWRASRFNPTQALEYVLEGAHRPQEIRAYERQKHAKRGRK